MSHHGFVLLLNNFISLLFLLCQQTYSIYVIAGDAFAFVTVLSMYLFKLITFFKICIPRTVVLYPIVTHAGYSRRLIDFIQKQSLILDGIDIAIELSKHAGSVSMSKFGKNNHIQNRQTNLSCPLSVDALTR